MAVELSDFTVSTNERRFDARYPLPATVAPVTAFIGRTLRGPLNEPVVIGSFEEYRRRFGGHCAFGFLSHAVRHYFLHGGRAAIVVRVANRALRAGIEVPAGAEFLRLQARAPGAHEFLRVSVDYDRLETSAKRFNLVVQRVARSGSELVEDQEFFQDVSVEEADGRFIVDVLGGSELVRLSGPIPRQRPEATRARNPGQPIPYLSMTSNGTDGEELTDYDLIGSNAEGTGLFALDAVERVDLICLPAPPSRDLGITTFFAAARYAERRRAMLIWDPPAAWASPEQALIGMRTAGHSSHHAVTYFPRLACRDAARRHDDMPACGVVAGLLAVRDRDGAAASIGPEGMPIRSGFSPAAPVSDRQAAQLNRHGINVFRVSSIAAAAFDGNVTMAGPAAISDAWRRLDTRRLVLFILGSLERHAARLLQAAPDQATWRAFERQARAFLRDLHGRGALAGARSEQAYFVKRRPAPAGAGLRLGVAVHRPSEFLVYDIDHDGHGPRLRAAAAQEAGQLAG